MPKAGTPALGRLAAITALLQKNPFKDNKRQKLELWLQHATCLLETSGCDRESWGTAILSALETVPQQAVYQQLNDAVDAAAASGDGTFCSCEQVTKVLKELYTAKETSGELLEQLTELSLTGLSPDAIGTYRDSFRRSAASISQQLYSDETRCLLITSKMPKPVQFGLAILEPIRVPSKLLETVRELAHKVAGPCQKWWEERSATLAKGKAKQRVLCRGCCQASKGSPPRHCWLLFLTLCTTEDRPTDNSWQVCRGGQGPCRRRPVPRLQQA